MNIKFTQYVCVIACILIPMCTSSTFAQENNSPSMYTKAQLKFMMRNGFDTEHYDWKNSKVNALLDGAMLSKSGSGGLIGLGVTTFVLSTGLSVASIGALAGNQSQTAHSDEQKNSTGILLWCRYFNSGYHMGDHKEKHCKKKGETC